VTPVEYDLGAVAAALGERPLELDLVDRVCSPFITINGRIHGLTSDFIRDYARSRPNIDTCRRLASDLAGWVNYLCNDCGLAPFEDARDPMFMATEDHFSRYYRLRQYGPTESLLTSEGWRRASSAIKRAYEYLLRRFQHRPPFDIVTVKYPNRYRGTTIAGYKPRRQSTGSSGTPLTPDFADRLLMGALRVDLLGRQDSYRGADRDHAILSLGLGAGLRRNNLANITTYEVPPESPMPLTTMSVADRITKGDAGGDVFVFSHRLAAVHDYMNGSRVELAAERRRTPPDALQILEANSVRVRYVDACGEVFAKRWSILDDRTRRRLVDLDGSSPILFLNENTGAPLSWGSLRHASEGSKRFVVERIDADFPAGFRLHDLRHTYAVHLTIAIFQGVVARSVSAEKHESWIVDRLAAAVDMVQLSLGHASEASTRLYIQTAHRFLDIDVERFIGGDR
jgi:integrase